MQYLEPLAPGDIHTLPSRLPLTHHNRRPYRLADLNEFERVKRKNYQKPSSELGKPPELRPLHESTNAAGPRNDLRTSTPKENRPGITYTQTTERQSHNRRKIAHTAQH